MDELLTRVEKVQSIFSKGSSFQKKKEKSHPSDETWSSTMLQFLETNQYNMELKA